MIHLRQTGEQFGLAGRIHLLVAPMALILHDSLQEELDLLPTAEEQLKALAAGPWRGAFGWSGAISREAAIFIEREDGCETIVLAHAG